MNNMIVLGGNYYVPLNVAIHQMAESGDWVQDHVWFCGDNIRIMRARWRWTEGRGRI